MPVTLLLPHHLRQQNHHLYLIATADIVLFQFQSFAQKSFEKYDWCGKAITKTLNDCRKSY